MHISLNSLESCPKLEIFLAAHLLPSWTRFKKKMGEEEWEYRRNKWFSLNSDLVLVWDLFNIQRKTETTKVDLSPPRGCWHIASWERIWGKRRQRHLCPQPHLSDRWFSPSVGICPLDDSKTFWQNSAESTRQASPVFVFSETWVKQKQVYS